MPLIYFTFTLYWIIENSCSNLVHKLKGQRSSRFLTLVGTYNR